MQTLTQLPQTREVLHIHNFRELFGVDSDIDDAILTRQREVFGFSFFLLHSKSVYEALKIGFLNTRNHFEKVRSILSIPHTYIFGSFLLMIALMAIHATFLFLPIVFTLLFFAYRPLAKIIQEKIELFKRSRIFFNITVEQAEAIKNDFFTVVPYVRKKMMWKNSGGKESFDGNSLGGRIFFFLFGQIFIIILTNIGIITWFVFDFLLFLILFGWLEKIIYTGYALYYSFYFRKLDHHPELFSREDQERDFYMDLYLAGNRLLTSMDELEKDMTDLKENGIIQPSLSKNLSSTIEQIGVLYLLIMKNSQFLTGKEKFQSFLINMLNEVIITYTYVFEFFTDRIDAISKDIDMSGIDEKQRDYLLNIIKPILDTRKAQLMNMKQAMLSKLIV